MGDLTSLMESMRRHGLLNPVVVNKNHDLIAGHRRLESAKKLGWTSIEVIILDTDEEVEKLNLEIDENIHRKNLTPDELADAYERLDRLQNPGTLKKLWARIVVFFRSIFRRRRKRT